MTTQNCYTNSASDLNDIKSIKHFIFRLEGDTKQLREATQQQIDSLRRDFSTYTFEVIYGVK